MQVLTIEHKYAMLYLCPFCNQIGEIQQSDYTTHPMIWCDGCGARCVFDKMKLYKTPQVAQTTIDDRVLQELNSHNFEKQDFDHVMPITMQDVLNGKYRLYWVPLLFIERVRENVLNTLYSLDPTAPSPVSDSELREWFNGNPNLERLYTDDELVKQVTPPAGMGWDIPDSDEEYIDEEDRENYHRVEQISLPVNSFNDQKPTVAYPNHVDLSHDGMCIYLKCRDANEQTVYVTYWGD